MSKTSLLSWINQGYLSIPTLLLTNYKNLHLNEQELVLLLQVMNFIEKGNQFPTPEELSTVMCISTTQCSSMLRTLIQKGFIQIIDGDSPEGIRFEKYSLEPLWVKLVDFFLIKEKHNQAEVKQVEEVDLYSCFEGEFGRPLSPFECETLAMWVDEDLHEPVIIKTALKEAVISGKLNFRYIDRILFEWKKNGIKTVDQAKSYSGKFRRHQALQKPSSNNDQNPKAVPFYNWLEQ